MSILKNDYDDCNDNDDSENVYELERGFLRRGRLRRKLLSLSLWTIFLLLDNFFALDNFWLWTIAKVGVLVKKRVQTF